MSSDRRSRAPVSVRIYRWLLRFLPAEREHDVAREISQTFEDAYDHARRTRGRSGALRVAVFGLVDLITRIPREWLERDRSTRATSAKTKAKFLSGFAHDLRHAGRHLRRTPGYAAVVIVTFGLGIGANTVVFSLVNGVLLTPLPYPDPDRLITIAEVNAGIDIPPRWASIPNYFDWQEQTSAFESLALYRGRSMSITGEGPPLYVYGAFVSTEFFSTLGVTPTLGRDFAIDHDGPSLAPVVVLSDALWRSRFGADRDVLGQTIVLDGGSVTVIGVMPPGFEAPADWIGATVTVGLWRPFQFDLTQQSRLNRSYHVVGRLAHGATLQDARSDMNVIGARLSAEYPSANGDWTLELTSWHDIIVGDVRSALLLLWVMVGLILLIACANVANLKLNRMLSRRGEIAIRSALGAGRTRLIRHVVTEGLVLAMIGGAFGIVLAYGALDLILILNPGRLPLTRNVSISGSVMLVSLGVTMLAGLVASVFPAWHGSRADLTQQLREGAGRSVAGRRGLRSTLAVVQLTAAFTLLIGAGLVARSFRQLAGQSPGLNPDNVVTASVALSWNRVGTAEERSRFIADVLTGLEALPGIQAAAMVNSLPFSGSNQWQPVWFTGEPIGDPSEQPMVALRNISQTYLTTMEIPVLRGRGFDVSDLESATAMLNQRAGERLFPGEDPVGQRLILARGADTVTIVGVAGDVRHFGLDKPARPELYRPYTRDQLTSKTFVVKTDRDPAAVGSAMRDVILGIDPDQPIRDISTMNAFVETSVAGPRFNAAMLTLGSGVATVLALVGLFAVISYTVTERSREIGIRVALGQSPTHVVRSLVYDGGRLAVVGIATGVVIAVLTGRVFESLLFELSPYDWMTYTLVAAGFLVAALVATYVPARRASGVHPAEILAGD